MPVFKVFFQILKTKSTLILIYMAVFMTFMAANVSQSRSSGETMFESKNLSIAVYDECRDDLSDQVIRMLQSDNQVELLDTASDTAISSEKQRLRELNDNVRYGIYDYALILPSTFGTDYQYNYFATTESSAGYIVSRQIDTFLKCVKINTEAGMDPGAAVREAAGVAEAAQGAPVRMISFPGNGGGHSGLYYAYKFMCYSLMMTIVTGICTVLSGMKNEDLLRRIRCSALSNRAFSLARFLASLLFATAIMCLFIVMAALVYREDTTAAAAAARILNLIPVCVCSAAFAYLLSALTADESIINMVTNMVCLSMSFMCGVFIDPSILSAGVLKAAQFMPFYWYVRGVSLADQAVGITSPAFLECIGIQLLFAAAFTAGGIVISRSKAAGR